MRGWGILHRVLWGCTSEPFKGCSDLEQLPYILLMGLLAGIPRGILGWWRIHRAGSQKKEREERRQEAGETERGKKEKDQRRKEKERKKRKTWGSGTNTCTDDQLMNISTAISNRRKNNKQWIENGFCCLSTGFSHSSTHSSCPPWSPCPIASEQCGSCFFLLPYFIQQVLKKPGLGLDLRIQGGSPKQRMGLPSENFHSLLSFQGCPSWDVTSSSPAYYALLPTSPAPDLCFKRTPLYLLCWGPRHDFIQEKKFCFFKNSTESLCSLLHPLDLREIYIYRCIYIIFHR